MFGKVVYSMPSMFFKEISKTVDIEESSSSKYTISDFQPKNYFAKTKDSVDGIKSIKKIENYGQEAKFKTGSHVKHEKFGNGTIIGKIGNFYEVGFEDGLKRVISMDFLKK